MPAVRVARGQFITAGQLIVDCCRVAEIIDFNYLDLVSLSPLCLLDRKKKRGKKQFTNYFPSKLAYYAKNINSSFFQLLRWNA